MNKSHSASLVRVECFFCKKEADLCNAAAASHQALQSHPQQSVPSKTANSIIQTLSDTESVTEKNNNERLLRIRTQRSLGGLLTACGSHGLLHHLTSQHQNIC
jgi:membrane-bound ClpP family serine protease